jgi:hypothetical protein
MYDKYLYSVRSVCCLPCCKRDIISVWHLVVKFLFEDYCHVSICNSLPAQIRSVISSKPLAMTPLLNETLLCALTCYAAFYGPRVLCTQHVYFKISKFSLSTLQNAVRSGKADRVKPRSGDRSNR